MSAKQFALILVVTVLVGIANTTLLISGPAESAFPTIIGSMAATLLAGFFVVFVYDSVTEDEVLTMEDMEN